MRSAFDYIVVGAGTAGCVLAARLSASGRHRVLLLEAGCDARHPWTRIPIAYARLLGNPAYTWGYRTEPEPGLGGRVLDVPCGRVVGGTGAINGMIYIRGHAADYDAWRDAGNEGWSYADVLPWFRRSETNARGADAWRGGDGPLPVCDPPDRHPLADAFVAAAIEAGHPHCADFNAALPDGAGHYQINTRRGLRASTATEFLAPARRRPNLTVVTEANVVRVIVADGRARGVEYIRHGSLDRAMATREVVLAGGTFNSPQLLQRSGIGPAAQLVAHHIPIAADRPGVGANLQNHYRASIVMRCREPVTLNDALRTGPGRARAALRYLVSRRGPLASSIHTGGFFRSAPDVARPDLQVTFWTYSVARRGGARGFALHPFSAFTANVVLLRPQSRGTVRLNGADPAAPPAIAYHHLAAEADRRTLMAGVRLVRRILTMPALARYAGEEIAPGLACQSDAALETFVRDDGSSVYHPVGTCRMGRDGDAVVDRFLRVHGVAGLRVADASVMPTIPSGNTNAPTLMIAERAAAWVLRDAGEDAQDAQEVHLPM